MTTFPGLSIGATAPRSPTTRVQPLTDLDSLPLPDYRDFYAALQAVPGSAIVECRALSAGDVAGLLVGRRRVLARFCGMDSRERRYRAKSAGRVITELRELSALLASARLIHLADNVVSPAFLGEVLPDLAADPLPTRLFFEARPNLTKEQVAMLAPARAQIQPGIESFNDHVLRLMHKGTRGLENIRLLKWCKAAGVEVYWNLLHGLPGETQDDYDAQLRMLPSIRFLPAPHLCQTVNVDRYSPYFEEPGRYGIERLSSLAPYRYLYPFPEGPGRHRLCVRVRLRARQRPARRGRGARAARSLCGAREQPGGRPAQSWRRR